MRSFTYFKHEAGKMLCGGKNNDLVVVVVVSDRGISPGLRVLLPPQPLHIHYIAYN